MMLKVERAHVRDHSSGHEQGSEHSFHDIAIDSVRRLVRSHSHRDEDCTERQVDHGSSEQRACVSQQHQPQLQVSRVRNDIATNFVLGNAD